MYPKFDFCKFMLFDKRNLNDIISYFEEGKMQSISLENKMHLFFYLHERSHIHIQAI